MYIFDNPSTRTMAYLVVTLMVNTTIFMQEARSQPASINKEVRLANSVIHPVDRPPKIVAYSFNNVELEKLQGDADVGVIIHHGKPLQAVGYNVVYSHSETLPFYVNRQVGVAKLSFTQSKNILAGETKNWADLGGADLPINIYVPSADLKKKALAFQLGYAGSTLQAPARSSGSYYDLAAKLREDPGAIILGLRSEPAQPKNLADVMRVEPESEPGKPMFNVPIYIYIRTDSPEAQDATIALLRRVSVRAAEDGMNYPLADRLDLIHR